MAEAPFLLPSPQGGRGAGGEGFSVDMDGYYRAPTGVTL